MKNLENKFDLNTCGSTSAGSTAESVTKLAEFTSYLSPFTHFLKDFCRLLAKPVRNERLLKNKRLIHSYPLCGGRKAVNAFF